MITSQPSALHRIAPMSLAAARVEAERSRRPIRVRGLGSRNSGRRP